MTNQPTTAGGSEGQGQSEKSFSTLVNEFNQEAVESTPDQEIIDDTVDETPEDEEDTTGDDGATQTLDDVDAIRAELQKLKEETNNARDVSAHKDRLRKEARAEAQQLQDMLTGMVEENPAYIEKVREQDEKLADRIAQKLWEVDSQTFLEEVERQKGGSTQSLSKDELRKELEALLEEKEQVKAKETLEETELSFIKKLGIKAGDAKLKAFMREYQQFQPRTAKEAEIFLNHAKEKVFGRKASSTDSINNLPTVSGGKGQYQASQKREPSKALRVMAKKMGITQKALEQYYNKK